MMRFAAPVLALAVLLASACVTSEEPVDEGTATGDLEPAEDAEDPIPGQVEELDDGTIVEAIDEGTAPEDELPEGAIAALGRRRVCVYEGRNKTGRASCWYAPSAHGACRTVSRITTADYCGSQGCVRDNTVSSTWINADTWGLKAYLYTGTSLSGTRYGYSVYRGNGYNNLSTSTSVKENQASSIRVCNY